MKKRNLRFFNCADYTDTKQPSFSFALDSGQKEKQGQTVTVRHAEILNPDGTPYILFALTNNDHADVAYKMLLNTKCPSWLYEVRMGATTIWERWDGLVSAEWRIESGQFTAQVQVPVGTTCQLTLPDGTGKIYGGGKYTASCPYRV